MSGDSLILGSLSDCVSVEYSGNNYLGLELVVELPQCLMLVYGILAVENCLLPITICLSLLLFYLLFHVSEHLKELIFVQQRGCLDVGDCAFGEVELMSLVVCG